MYRLDYCVNKNLKFLLSHLYLVYLSWRYELILPWPLYTLLFSAVFMWSFNKLAYFLFLLPHISLIKIPGFIFSYLYI